jgi:hypothetical protein
MTVAELYNSVAQLGFETSLESDDRFVFAVNRAILQVNRIKPATSIYKLNHFPLKNVIGQDTFSPICKSDNELIFVAHNAKSYYFECNGNGTLAFEKPNTNGGWDTFYSVTLSSADGSFKRYKGFIKDGDDYVAGAIRMRFYGVYTYYVQNVALYSNFISDRADDIQVYGKYIEYDIASRVSDFLSFAKPPIVDAKRGVGFVLNGDYFIEGEGKICIPASANGVFDICYNRRPTAITAEDVANTATDKNIDLNEELCAILPNLVASYIWLEDEPEKAQYYLSLYREQVAEIEARAKDLRPLVYRNKTGW